MMHVNKKQTLLFAAVLMAVLSVCIYSCTKTDVRKMNVDTKTFSVADAKEWWYGSFKKSEAFKMLDNQSPYVQIAKGYITDNLSGFSVAASERYPSWKRGITYKIGNMQAVEMPIFYTLKQSLIPREPNITDMEYRKIAVASVDKIMIVKKNDGSIIVRLITLIPTFAYAQKKNFDIATGINLNNLDKKFEGTILVRDWNEQPIATWKIKDGRRFYLEFKKKEVLNTPNNSAAQNCYENWEIIGYHMICTGAPQGDEPSNTYCDDHPELWRQGGPIYGYVTHCEDLGDPFGDCYGSLNQNCSCILYGMDCGDGGGNGGDGPPSNEHPTPCDNADSLEKNNEYKEKFDSLKHKTSDNKEYGYTFKLNGAGSIDENSIEGDSGTAGIEFTISGKIDGFIHSHYTGLLSIFSPDDLYAMASLYVHDQIVNPTTFTAGVVTASGTQYIITIDDLAKFQLFANNLVNNSTLNLYSDIYEKLYNIKPSNDKDANEKAFLNYIQQTKSGLKLFKGDANFNNWQPKKVDENGNVTNSPC